MKEKVLPPCRVSQTEHALIKDKAAKCGLSLSEYMRRCCLDGYVIEQQPLADIALIKELKRQGANFNQYQHKLNSHAYHAPDEVKRVASKIEHLLDTLLFSDAAKN